MNMYRLASTGHVDTLEFWIEFYTETKPELRMNNLVTIEQYVKSLIVLGELIEVKK